MYQKNRLILILFVLLVSVQVFPQNIIKTDSIVSVKIKELGFMVGNWEGDGWILGEHGKSEFQQTEKIQFKLDSTAILIEGQGKWNGEVVHDALAILTFNKKENNYTFRSYLPNGQNSAFKAEVLDKKLYWYPGKNVRYIIWEKENGQWFEKGEFKKDEKWTQFFEMTLNKIE